MACQSGCSCNGGCQETTHTSICGCDQPISTEPVGTACDRDRKNNVWVEGADADGNGGICLLDNLCEQQIVDIIQRDEVARVDLIRVSTNPELHKLAVTVPRLPGHNEGDKLQQEMNQGTLPFYTVFRGQPPFAQ
jgi:hypothetical protein